MKAHHSISVRPATSADLEQVYALEQLCSRNPWTRSSIEAELSNPDRLFLVLETPENLIAGFAGAWLAAEELQILEVAVHKDYRNTGLGTLLITRQLAEAEAKGAARACLEVRTSNSAAIRLYQKCGFTRDGIRERYYQNGEDAILMSKPLGGEDAVS
ncbi:MAG: ribosomal protein S18-alanine N-acetyltransferase [Chitinispirillia bacterium]|nr:ribosomal protein S18-alanine N-acetyltransferase [Chitinispirillia bacterium]MCL2241882.1 ribosomal protein S18-alanine N-acetyltransferase [Chitinispirillia bacterium]